MKKFGDFIAIPIVALFIVVGWVAGYISVGFKAGWNIAWTRTND